MSAVATLAMTLLAAAAAEPVVPLGTAPLPAARGEGNGAARGEGNGAARGEGNGTGVVPLVGEPVPPAAGPPRVVVCVPKGGVALEPQVARAFSWAELATISPDTVARRFPPSPASRAIADDERRVDAP